MSAEAAPRGNRLFIKKSVDQVQREAATHHLKRTLGPVNLVLFGIGCIIGAGIYVMTGNAAATYAGPAVMLSFVVAGLACAFAGLCYAELASTMPVAGSAYTYSYTTLGELFAWIMGWLLVLEYGVAAATVAAGWSGNVVSLLGSYHIVLPPEITTSFIQAVPGEGGHLVFSTGHGLNLIGAAGILLVTILLVIGVSESATVNNVIVLIKVGVLLAFIAYGFAFINMDNYTPFIPPNEGGFTYGLPGIFRAASVVFFAYVGFEAVSTAAAESRNPQRDMPIGILGSLFVCTIIYMLVAAVLTGIVPFRELGVAAPIALAVDRIGIPWFSVLIKVGAIAGLTSVMLILTYGQSRVFYSMARDGLLPRAFAKLHVKFRTPWIGTIILGVLIAIAAAMLPISILGDLVSLGTAVAFGIVCMSVMWLRNQRPDLARPFKVPLGGGRLPMLWIIVMSVVIGLLLLVAFKALFNSGWTKEGSIGVVILGVLWLLTQLRDLKKSYWVGVAPILGIIGALFMATPLVEDVVLKAQRGDTLPAMILTGYAVLGAAIYLFYGLWNSRLAKGLDILEDPDLPSAMEAQVHGLDERR